MVYNVSRLGALAYPQTGPFFSTYTVDSLRRILILIMAAQQPPV